MKAITLALILAMPFTGMAASKHKSVSKHVDVPAEVISTPLPTDPSPLDLKDTPLAQAPLTDDERNAIVAQAEADLDALQKKLDDALAASAETKNQLNTTSQELNAADGKTVELQKKIDEETTVLEQTRDALNKQIAESMKWKADYDEAEKKLWFWRKIAIAIGSAIALYGGFLALKAFGKFGL